MADGGFRVHGGRQRGTVADQVHRINFAQPWFVREGGDAHRSSSGYVPRFGLHHAQQMGMKPLVCATDFLNLHGNPLLLCLAVQFSSTAKAMLAAPSSPTLAAPRSDIRISTARAAWFPCGSPAPCLAAWQKPRVLYNAAAKNIQATVQQALKVQDQKRPGPPGRYPRPARPVHPPGMPKNLHSPHHGLLVFLASCNMRG